MENIKPSNANLNMNFYDDDAKMAELPHASQYDFLLERNKNYMESPALTFFGKLITYEELHTRIDEYARTLYKKGVRESDLIATSVANTPEGIYLDYAINKLGAISVPISLINNEYKTKQDLAIVQPKMYIGVEDVYGMFKRASEGMNIVSFSYPAVESMDKKMVKLIYGAQQYIKRNRTFSKEDKLMRAIKEGKNADAVFPEFKDGEISHIIFTGGSSGTHKGVMLDNNGLNCVVRALDYVLPLNPEEKFMGNLPQFMAFGKMAMHYALCKSMQVDLTLKAMPQDFKDELFRLKPQGVFAGPVQWEHFVNDVFKELTDKNHKIDFSLNNITDYKEYLENLKEILKTADKGKYDMSWLNVAVSGGEQLKFFTERIVTETLGEFGAKDPSIYNGLGMTEMWAPVSVKMGSKCHEGTIGPMMPFTNQMIVDLKTHEELGFDEIGLLLVTGPGMMHGYYNNPEESKEVFIEKDGVRWLNSGDIAKVLPTGELVYIDRLKRSFVCGVENVYPQQIENMLSEIPEIRESIVTKIPDNDLQFVPKYHISLREKCDIKQLENKIDAMIGTTLGDSNLARFYEFYDEPLPRTANGKLDPKPLQQKDFEAVASANAKKLQR